MRRAPRCDRNHPEIVRALKQAGCSVQSLAGIGFGCPDLIVGVRGKNLLVELKDGEARLSDQKLTDDEKIWHACWLGEVHIVKSVAEALKLIGVC